MHLFVPTHGVPQPPQLPWSVCVFTHAPLQNVGKFGLLQVAMHLPSPLQVKVPFAGRAGQLEQALPHSIEPEGQLLHLPPLQLSRFPSAPIGHAFPHPPQLFGSLAVSTSQPSEALWLQSCIGGKHEMPHEPPEHHGEPPVELHRLLQPPQLFGSVDVSISHPFHALPSQSLNCGLGLHETIEQPEFSHFSTAWFVLHDAPQDPQLPVSFVVFTQCAPSPEPQSFGWSPGQL